MTGLCLFQSENSQLETKLSGMPVSSVGKRDSLLGKSAELKDKSATKTSKPVSVSLDSDQTCLMKDVLCAGWRQERWCLET